MPYYKAVRLDRTSHYDQHTKWRCGAVVRVTDPDLSSTHACGRGIHCSPTLLDAVSYQAGPSRYYLVDPIEIIASDATKARCTGVRVLRELRGNEMDELAGFKLLEANHPVNPLLVRRRISDDEARDLVGRWNSVAGSVAGSVWGRGSDRGSVAGSVWGSVRGSVWGSVWGSVENSVENSVRDSFWGIVENSIRDSVWGSVEGSFWGSVENSVRDSVWDSVGAYMGGLFPDITSWKYAKGHGPDPWRPLLTLWYGGILPSFDGGVWRLHAGPRADVVLSINRGDLT